MAGDRQGSVYNVNADQMAVACAAAFGAERLIFLTDVEGVLERTGRSGRGSPPCESAATDRRRRGHRRHAGQAERGCRRSGARRGAGADRAGGRPGVLARVLADQPVGTRLIAAEVQTA